MAGNFVIAGRPRHKFPGVDKDFITEEFNFH